MKLIDCVQEELKDREAPLPQFEVKTKKKNAMAKLIEHKMAQKEEEEKKFIKEQQKKLSRFARFLRYKDKLVQHIPTNATHARDIVCRYARL